MPRCRASPPVAGQQFEYAFDIGNRQSTKAGGDNSGANLRPASYLNNPLNQILSREVPSYVNVLGTASNTATVTLWGDNGSYSPTTRKGEYFRGELYANNATGAVWLTITNVAVLNNGANPDIVTNAVGRAFVPKTPETFYYDLDGNLTRDGSWTNIWNGENRRVTIESGAGVPPAARMREQWTHLPDGRWIQRIVSTNNGAAYYPAYTNRYVWDEQVLLAVLDHTNGLVMSFMRGLDLSGSIQGAGGVGGVLAVNFKTNGTHFCAYDGNGNVTALASAANGSESARYEYGPFAEPIRMTGPMAKLNPIRFSSQYADDVTGDVKYLYRDYDPSTGRWLTRDPIEERGGQNVYGCADNDAVGRIDQLGRLPRKSCGRCGPNVTKAILQMLKDVETEFLDDNNPNYRLPAGYQGPVLPPDEYRYEACKALFTPGPAGTVWDSAVGKLGAPGGKKKLPAGISASDLGTRHCEGTVVFQGRCVYASGLNYMLFGKANKLCHDKFANRPYTFRTGASWLPKNYTTTWSQIDMLKAVAWHKFVRYGPLSPMGRPWSCVVWSAFNFANEGYTGDQYQGGTPCMHNCDIAGVKEWPSPMEGKWTGVFNNFKN